MSCNWAGTALAFRSLLPAIRSVALQPTTTTTTKGVADTKPKTVTNEQKQQQ
jgi:hypothetical protein